MSPSCRAYFVFTAPADSFSSPVFVVDALPDDVEPRVGGHRAPDALRRSGRRRRYRVVVPVDLIERPQRCHI